jgi:hypothetical protein
MSQPSRLARTISMLKWGCPQGSILSPVLFNVYLEEALKSSKKLEEVRSRGDLLAFADDMLVMSNNQHEVEQIIGELTAL